MGFAVAVFQLLRTQVRLKLYSLWHNEPLYRRTWYKCSQTRRACCVREACLRGRTLPWVLFCSWPKSATPWSRWTPRPSAIGSRRLTSMSSRPGGEPQQGSGDLHQAKVEPEEDAADLNSW